MTAVEALRLQDIDSDSSRSLRLGSAEVHLWRGSLEPPIPVLERLTAWLSPGEVARAWRFHAAADRDRFLAAHGWLRLLLSRYVDGEPGDLEFEEGSAGKPMLMANGAKDIRFNLAHSGGVVVCAVARGREIGIDVERIKDAFDWDALAANYFSAPERAAVSAMSGELRTRMAYVIWTRKEAWIKAVGLGLGLDLENFDVSGPGDEPVWLSSDAPPLAASGSWTLFPVDAGEEYAAAVAVEGQDVRIGAMAEIDLT